MKALITGASSGIGEAYAERFACMGYDLIITGRRESLLHAIGSRFREKYNISVEEVILELADDQDLDSLAEKIKKTQDLYVLVNNAGFGSRSQFMEGNYKEKEDMVKVHILVTMKLIHAAVPVMRKLGGGIIINVSSLGSKLPLSTGSIYNASKSFLRIFTESLYLENIHSNILFQSLCPGFTRTDFHGRIGYTGPILRNRGIIRWMSPEKVVDISLKNLRNGKVVCIPGFWNKVLWTLADLIPKRIYYRIIRRAGIRTLLYTDDHVLQPSGIINQAGI